MWSAKHTAVAMLLVVLTTPALAAPSPGDMFPDLRTQELEGVLPEIEDRVLVVDFWASWCAPCRRSFPALSRLHEEFHHRGVTVLAVSVDRKRQDYEAFLQGRAPPFATLRDATHRLVSQVRPPVMPTTVIVDATGVVRAVFAGFHGDETEQGIRAALEKILPPP
jgi:thiol-disulfide isomerase/thioredoxin